MMSKLYYYSRDQFDIANPQQFADMCRVNVLYQVQKAGRGHLGACFSSLDIITHLYLNVLTKDDYFFSSRGHDAAAFYAVLTALGELPFDEIHRFRQPGGYPGHTDPSVPGFKFTSGSLGMGISKAKGLALAKKMRGEPGRVFVLVGDGELDEGQCWEALSDIPPNLYVIIDGNGLSTDRVIDDSNWPDGCLILNSFYKITNEPTVIVGPKGKGVSFMENMPDYHSGPLTYREYRQAVYELVKKTQNPNLAIIEHKDPSLSTNMMVIAYARELNRVAKFHRNVVCLCADLKYDCGVNRFADNYPNRYIECGIAEQDMVSMASGLAAGGYIPVCHSFAPFLTQRANEQIYINCTEGRRIIYVGFMAGRLDNFSGPSHNVGDRDLQCLSGLPIRILEPGTPGDIPEALHRALHETGPSYIRIRGVS